MSNYKEKLEKMLGSCYQDIITWVKTNPTSANPSSDEPDAIIYHKILPESQLIWHINPNDIGETISTTITEISYIDYGGCGSIDLMGQSTKFPIEEVLEYDTCCLADYVNNYE